MKKLFLLFVASMLTLTGVKAEGESNLVATLNREGKLLAYYGPDALISAYNAAKDGDVITLSAGTFKGPSTMSKNITVRGVGAWIDNNYDNYITEIKVSSYYLNIQLQNNENEFIMEGVKIIGPVNVSGNAKKKCTFSKIYIQGKYSYTGCSFDGGSNCFPIFVNCVTSAPISLYDGACTNSLLAGFVCRSTNETPTFQNCVIWNSEGLINLGTWKNCVFSNCLLITNGGASIDVSNSVHNCVAFITSNKDINIFENLTNTTNKMVADRDKFFKSSSVLKKNADDFGDLVNYVVNWDDLDRNGHGLFELSDEAKQLYKGDDGTVVGLWGGTMPFSMKPSNPRLTKCEIVPRVGDDGKLNITIEVAQ